MTTPPSLDAEFTRKVALGILSTLQLKGLLTSEEVDAILIAARRAAATESGPSVSALGARRLSRGPLSDPPKPRPPAPTASPTGKQFFNLSPRTENPTITDPPAQASVTAAPEAGAASAPEISAPALSVPPALPAIPTPAPTAKTEQPKAASATTQDLSPSRSLVTEPLVLDSLTEAERLAESRWTRKEPLPPPTFDIEL